MFKSKNKKNVEEYIESTYSDIVFDGKIKDVNEEDIEKALDKAYQEKNNEINEYYKLLTFFWGIQISALAISSQFLFLLLKNKDDNNLIISIIFSISFLSLIITLIQFHYLTLKENRIVSFLYHIIFLEFFLNRNIFSVYISNNELSPASQIFPSDLKIIIFPLIFIWDLVAVSSLRYFLVVKYNLADKNILFSKNILFDVIMILLFVISYIMGLFFLRYLNGCRKKEYKINESIYADIFIKKK